MKTKHSWIYPIVIISLLSTFSFGCRKDDPLELPVLSTLPVTEISINSAKSGGNITADGGAPVTARGVVWSTSENPTIETNVGMTADGEGTGGYTSNLPDLSSSTKYYVHAYATNNKGTAYGNQLEFTTKIQFAGGTGTQADPYLVETPAQLNGVRHNLDKHFRQIADIDLSGYNSGAGWIPIGDEANPFTGIFDGNGYKTKNLAIHRPDIYYVALGLFGRTDKSTIKNVDLVMIEITGKSHVGGLVGFNNSEAAIINCSTTGNVSGEDGTGGLVGVNWGTITNSYSIGNVSGDNQVGGLAGVNWGSITNSYATEEVSGDNSVGGLVGVNWGTITNSYATGNIIGRYYVGGLAGINSVSITNSFAIGNISGNEEVGGFVGMNRGIITDSYYDKETTGQDDYGKGVSKTTAEMMQQSTFEAWDFTNIWGIEEGDGYPYLQWEID
jgi:hypothetical protein